MLMGMPRGAGRPGRTIVPTWIEAQCVIKTT